MIAIHFCCAFCYKLFVIVRPSLEECSLMLCAFCEINAVAETTSADRLQPIPGLELPDRKASVRA